MNGEEERKGAWALTSWQAGVTMIAMFLGIIVIGIAFGYRWAAGNYKRNFEIEAVKQGHAEYIINKDYEKEWRWLPPCGKKEEKK